VVGRTGNRDPMSRCFAAFVFNGFRIINSYYLCYICRKRTGYFVLILFSGALVVIIFRIKQDFKALNNSWLNFYK